MIHFENESEMGHFIKKQITKPKLKPNNSHSPEHQKFS